jgi:glucose/mannose-6-phosphate isomerase
MLRAVASSGAQVRRGLVELDRTAIAELHQDSRPRIVVATGMGGSGIAGSILSALATRASAIPVVSVNDYTLPAWVGALDHVIAISCSGETEETLSAASAALRRGARLIAVTARDSSLHQLAQSSPNALTLFVDAQGLMPRASLWTLLTPVLMAAEALGVLSGVEPALEQAADHLDELSRRCGLDVPLEVNEAKTLGLALAESLPMVWGSGEIGGVAAYRMCCQLAENAKLPAVWGVLPEANHNQVVAFSGPAVEPIDVDDIFRDRVLDPDPSLRPRLVLVRDSVEQPQVAKRADLSSEIAAVNGMATSTLTAGEGPAIVRLADLIGVIDWATVYAALASGVDPTPIGPINTLKARLTP